MKRILFSLILLIATSPIFLLKAQTIKVDSCDFF